MFYYSYTDATMTEVAPGNHLAYAVGQTPREALDNAEEWLLDRIESALWCDSDNVSQWRRYLKMAMEYSR